MIEQNKLPNKYLVKVDKDHPLWNKFADYINKLEGTKLSFNCNYYGQDYSKVVVYSNVYSDYKLLTLEEWDSIVNPKFILPEKWVLRRTLENSLIVNEWSNKTHKDNFYSIVNADYIYSDRKANGRLREEEGYTEITFNEFKEHVLNKTNNNMSSNNTENQEIVGYRIKKEYIRVVSELTDSRFTSEATINFQVNSVAYNKLDDLKVLAIFCDPVYKPKYQLPVISSYSGEYIKEKGIIKYGCVEFYANWVSEVYEITMSSNGMPVENNRTIKSIVLDNGTVINSDQLKQIVDYINNK